MHPTVLRRTIAGCGEPALISHQQLAVHRRDIHTRTQPEKRSLGRDAQDRLIDPIGGGYAVGHRLPNDWSGEVRGRLQNVVNGGGWPRDYYIGVYQLNGKKAD